jgi:hypothetical protein
LICMYRKIAWISYSLSQGIEATNAYATRFLKY